MTVRRQAGTVSGLCARARCAGGAPTIRAFQSAGQARVGIAVQDGQELVTVEEARPPPPGEAAQVNHLLLIDRTLRSDATGLYARVQLAEGPGEPAREVVFECARMAGELRCAAARRFDPGWP